MKKRISKLANELAYLYYFCSSQNTEVLNRLLCIPIRRHFFSWLCPSLMSRSFFGHFGFSQYFNNLRTFFGPQQRNFKTFLKYFILF